MRIPGFYASLKNTDWYEAVAVKYLLVHRSSYTKGRRTRGGGGLTPRRRVHTPHHRRGPRLQSYIKVCEDVRQGIDSSPPDIKNMLHPLVEASEKGEGVWDW